MLLPSVFNGDLFDNFFDDMFLPTVRPVRLNQEVMRTDVKELEDKYELSVELPGFKKEDVKLSLKDGYLTIEGKVEVKDEDSKFLRRERYYGEVKRSYFVGKGVKEEDIKAKFSDGILLVDLKKVEPEKIEDKLIPID